MKYDVKNIIDLYRSGQKLKYVFFWGHTERWGMVTKVCFSQWYDCLFMEDDVIYHTAEQYMMAQKALLFGDRAVYEEIMAAEHPKKYKALGKKVSGFSDKVWDAHKYEIVVKGNLAKFSQNPELMEFLLGTNTRILVEASPYDNIWGIGMSADDKGVENPMNWKGENLLGFALMEVRDRLKK